MRLRRVVVDKWRGFGHACIDFSSDGFTVLTGPNNAGKSLLLTAAEKAATGGDLGEGAQTAAVWETEEGDQLDRATRAGEPRYLDGEVRGLVRVTTGGAGSEMVLLPRESAAALVERPFRSYEIFHPDLVGVPVYNGGGPSNGLLIQSSTSSSQTLSPSVSLELLNGMRELSTCVAYRLPTIRPGSERSIPAEASMTLAPDGSNLAHVLLWLQTRDGVGWKRVREFFESVFPDAGRLLAKVSEQEVEIVLNDGRTGQDRNLKDLGTGLEQLVLVAVACETQAPGSLVIVDEPEIGLHPGAQRVLAQRLHTWAADRRVLVASHSPVFVSESRGAGQTHIVTRTDGSAAVRAITQEQGEALSELGVAASDALGVDRFLVVEGPSDRHMIEALFSQLLLAGRIGLVEANGGTRVRPVISVVERIAAVFEGRVLGVIDADEGPRREGLGLHVLPCREIENLFLLMPDVVGEGLKRRGFEVEPSRIAATIDAAVDDWRLDALWLAAATSLRNSVELAPLRFQRHGADVALGPAGLKELRNRGASSLPDDESIDRAWQAAESRFESDWPSRRLDLVRGSKVLDAVFRSLSDDAAKYEKTRDLRVLADAAAAHRSSWPEPLAELERAIAQFATGDDEVDAS